MGEQSGAELVSQPVKEPTRLQWARMNVFLAEYRERGIIVDACKAVSDGGRTLERRTPGFWAREYPAFADLMAEAREEVNDKIEREIYRRGVEGWEEPVYQGGQQVGTIRKYDSTMLIFLAKANMPGKYRDKFEGANLNFQPNFNFAGDGVIRAIAGLSPEELERLASRGKPIEGEFKEVTDGASQETSGGDDSPGEGEDQTPGHEEGSSP
ncbi:hypothetical protein LCGC14_2524500 [marine sediment metagenome]|uniref:Uncharacterized protein n=1 Tax=marine sediment metagenome TaxID=412755 RepID=A0A0F9D6Y6_9ZZZZ